MIISLIKSIYYLLLNIMVFFMLVLFAIIMMLVVFLGFILEQIEGLIDWVWKFKK